MLVYFTKFFHILFAISLLSLVVYSLISAKKAQPNVANTFSHLSSKHEKLLLIISLLAMLTGTLLVIPKHYTFHTSWIEAAYILLTLFIGGVFVATRIKKRHINNISKKTLILMRVIYVCLGAILLLIMHDAINKSTFLF